MSQLIDMFIEPAKAWQQQKERPTFLLPAVLVALAVAVPAVLYFLRVDPEWFSNYQLQAMAQEMTSAEIEQAKAFMPGAQATAWITGISSLVMLVIVFAIMAAYYLLAGKVAGHAVSYRHGLSLSTWASVPLLLAGIVSLFGIYTSSPQTPYTSLQLLNIDPLFMELPLDHPWSTLAKSFSLLNLWVWFLAALGWKTWFRTGWGQAIFVVLLPSLVIYGVMALFAIL